MIIEPKQTEREKKHCVTAAYQTLGSKSFDHFGVRKKRMPVPAPSKVTALIRRLNKMIYGKMARKYEAFPELFTPWNVIRITQSQLNRRHNVNFQSGSPTPSSILSFSWRTTFLELLQTTKIENRKTKKSATFLFYFSIYSFFFPLFVV